MQVRSLVLVLVWASLALQVLALDVNVGGDTVLQPAGDDSSKAEITVISNDNKLHQIIPPPPTVDYAVLEEESQKGHKKEWAHKSEEDQKALAAEQLRKKEKEAAIKRESEREEALKKEKVEAGNKKIQEAEFKANAAERAKDESHRKTMSKREADEKSKVNAAEAKLKQAQQAHDFAENKRREEAQKAREKAAQEQKAKAVKVNLESDYRDYGSGYEGVNAEVVGRRCYLKGLVHGGGGMVAHLPPNCRPNGRLIFVGKTNLQARVDITNEGAVLLIIRQPGPYHGWLSLSGISFVVNSGGGDALQLVWGWQPYGYGYRAPSVTHDSGICMVSGLIRSGRWGYFGRVPHECYPRQRLIFNGNNHQTVTRVDMLDNGYFLYSGGSTNHGWVSLDGMVYNAQDGNALHLQSGWYNYDNGYRGAQYYKGGPVCVLSGLIRSGSWASLIATLPPECRPKQRLLFAANVHVNAARVDILPDGRVLYVDGKMHWDWLSLSGINFIP